MTGMPPEPATLRISQLGARLSDGDRQFRLRVEGLDLRAGEVVAVTGASGSGKTLFLELLGLLRAPEAGADYHLTDPATDLGGLWRAGPRSARLAAVRGNLFGFVPQTGGLIAFLSVEGNIALTQRISHREDASHRARLMGRLGLSALRHLRPAALSIGQRQRVAIARALAHRPAFVIADEPTAALDPDAADAVMALLLETARDEGAGLILSSHDAQRLDRMGLPRLHFTSVTDTEGHVLSQAVLQ